MFSELSGRGKMGWPDGYDYEESRLDINEYLIRNPVSTFAERNLARNTQFSYRDTLTLLPFVGRRAGAAIDRLSVEDISPDTVRGMNTSRKDSIKTKRMLAATSKRFRAEVL